MHHASRRRGGYFDERLGGELEEGNRLQETDYSSGCWDLERCSSELCLYVDNE